MSQVLAFEVLVRLIDAGVNRGRLTAVGYGDKRPRVRGDVDHVRLSVLRLSQPVLPAMAGRERREHSQRVILPAQLGPSGHRTADAVLDAGRLARDQAAARRHLAAKRFDAAYRILRGLLDRAPNRLDLRELFGVAQAGAGDLSGANETAAWVERHHGADRAEQLRRRQRAAVASSR